MLNSYYFHCKVYLVNAQEVHHGHPRNPNRYTYIALYEDYVGIHMIISVKCTSYMSKRGTMDIQGYHKCSFLWYITHIIVEFTCFQCKVYLVHAQEVHHAHPRNPQIIADSFTF